jgi:hypothetical protein
MLGFERAACGPEAQLTKPDIFGTASIWKVWHTGAEGRQSHPSRLESDQSYQGRCLDPGVGEWQHTVAGGCTRVYESNGCWRCDVCRVLFENPALFAGHMMKPVENVAGSLEELSREVTLNELALDSPSSIWLIRSSKLVKFDYICRSLIVFFVTVIMNKLSLQNHSNNEQPKITVTSKTFSPHYYMKIQYCCGIS